MDSSVSWRTELCGLSRFAALKRRYLSKFWICLYRWRATDSICSIGLIEDIRINEKQKEDVTAASQAPARQFGIAALFWLTFLVGVAVSYLQQQDHPLVLEGGLAAIVLGLAVGVTIGWLTRRFQDGVFWATLIAAFAYISVARDAHFDFGHRLVWATMGATCGAVAATILTERIWINAILCACFGELVFLIYFVATGADSLDFRLDLLGAPFIGIGVAFFIRAIIWLESKQKMPRYVTATWLLFAVILGNVFS